MKLAIVGAGAIGCYVGAQIKLTSPEVDIVMVGGSTLVNGYDVLKVSPENKVLKFGDGFKVTQAVDEVANADIIIIAVKSQITEKVCEQLLPLFENGMLHDGCPVYSFQNGVSNAQTIQTKLPRCHAVACMVGFNVAWDIDYHIFHRGTSGKLIIGSKDPKSPPPLVKLLKKTSIETQTSSNIKNILYSKLLINIFNPLNALSGLPVQTMISTHGWRKIWSAVYFETLEIYADHDIKPVKIFFPPNLFPYFLLLPDVIYNLLQGLFAKTDKKAKSSMLQDIERKKLTEIDYLCGEVVRLDPSKAILSKKLMILVHELEQKARDDEDGIYMSHEELKKELGI